MKVVFIIPVKAEAVSERFSIVLENLDRTLASITNSSDETYGALVISNDPEEIRPIVAAHPRVDVLPFPRSRDEGVLNPGAQDKHDKRMLAGVHLRKTARFPLWVMALDADDLIDENLVSYVVKSRSRTGFILTGGYIFSAKAKTLTFTRGFHRKSGSRCIFWVDRGDMPLAVDDWSSPYSLAIRNLNSSGLRQIGRQVKTIRWPAGLYVQGHSESISQDPRTREDKQKQIALRPWHARFAKRFSKAIWKIYLFQTNKFIPEDQKARILRRFGVNGATRTGFYS